MAGAEQLKRGVAADIAGSAGNQDTHEQFLLKS
jgi:hypothetical protein